MHAAGRPAAPVDLFPESFSALWLPALPVRVSSRVSIDVRQPTVRLHISSALALTEVERVGARCQPSRAFIEALAPASPNLFDVLATSFVRTRLSLAASNVVAELQLARHAHDDPLGCRAARIAVRSIAAALDGDERRSTVDVGRATVTLWPLAPLDGGMAAVLPGFGGLAVYSVRLRSDTTAATAAATAATATGSDLPPPPGRMHDVIATITACVGMTAYTAALLERWRMDRRNARGSDSGHQTQAAASAVPPRGATAAAHIMLVPETVTYL
jgi:hypothetical protein